MANESTGGKTRFQGLTAAQVEKSRQEHGNNVLTPPARDPWWKLFLEKFDDPVIRILIIAAVLATGVGIYHEEYVEGLGIIVAVLLATTLAFLNEYQAAKEFDILNKVNDEVPVKAVRDGNYQSVPRCDLVVGDVVLLELGEEVPADAKVLEAVSLLVDESRLTGESVPVTKDVEPAPSDDPTKHAYPVNKVLRGTMVVDGHSVAELTAVGDRTEIGTAAKAAAEETDEETPLNRQLARLSKLIGVVGLGVAMATFFALILRGVLANELVLDNKQWYFAAILGVGVMIALLRVWMPIVGDGFELAGIELSLPAWLEDDSFKGWLTTFGVGAGVVVAGIVLGYMGGMMSSEAWIPPHALEEFLLYFTIAVTIIVVAVPEGLAMSVTLSLAYSMRKMTAANNLVRKMHACETIGAATVICSDKTGTLTLNEMRVQEAVFPCLSQPFSLATLDENGHLIVEAMCANSTAQLGKTEGTVKALGNPTEGALLLWLDSHQVDYVPRRESFEVGRQWTFSTERKFMATKGLSPNTHKKVLHVKGAPEIVLELCTRILTPQGLAPIDEKRSAIEVNYHDFQKRAMRIIGFAYREVEEGENHENAEDAAHNLIWLGFVAIADAIRPEVPPAIASCYEAGVKVKMVTGDSHETAREIAKQIGLWTDADTEANHLNGRDFAALPDDQAAEAAVRLKVLSRARPLDKLRLVDLLKSKQEVVAVTGDGTNDAPALNHAHVGLAMGRTGTAVAKEASDIILLDDSFKSIVNAVMWGRSLYENIQRFVLFQLTINVTALCIAFIGPFLGVKLPLTVIQMLWVNLIMDTFAALALATEPPHPEVMKRKPRHPDDFIVTPSMGKEILAMGAFFVVALLGLLLIFKNNGYTGTDGKGNTIPVTQYEESMFFTIFVLLQFWNLFNARCLGLADSAFKGVMENRGFLVIAGVIFLGQVVITQFGGSVFRTEPLSFLHWILILGGTSIVLWIGEFQRWQQRQQLAAVGG